ncbi:MAG: trypsin-like peptidase domain-containing protein [Alphaproteobacteria bacterium]
MSIEIMIPQGGAEQSFYKFEDTKRRITVGREGGTADVVFNADQTKVSRQHFALDRKFDGVYEIDLRDERYVAVDGVPAQEGQALTGRHEITLGAADGPMLTINIVQQDTVTQTAPQKAMPDTRKTARRAQRLVLMAFALILTVGGAVGYYVYDQAQAFSPRMLEASSKSIMLAAVRNTKSGAITPLGTAWVVQERTLATNAHVALAIDPGDDPNLEQIVIGPDGTVYPVIQVRAHAAYEPFMEFTNRTKLAVDNTRGGASLDDAGGYDVALLFVKPSSNNPLPPPLPLAEIDEVLALPMGTKVAMIGYPMENIAGAATQSLSPHAQTQFGSLTDQTSYLFMEADDKYKQLLTHTLPLSGGASGSPILTEKGHVIGLVNAGNLFHTPSNGRIPSAALINYGMRLDVLLDMLQGDDEIRLSEYRAHWAEQAARITTAYTLTAKIKEQEWFKATNLQGEPVVMADHTAELQMVEGEVAYIGADYVIEKVEPGKSYFVSAVSDAGIVISSALFFSNDSVALVDLTPIPFTTLMFNVPEVYTNMRVHVMGPKLEFVDDEVDTAIRIRVLRTP